MPKALRSFGKNTLFELKIFVSLLQNALDERIVSKRNCGSKMTLFRKIEFFGAGHKIAVGHRICLDFAVF